MAATSATQSTPHGAGLKILAMAAMISIYFLSYIQRTSIPGTIFDDIQGDLLASATVVTSLGSLFFYSYAGVQLIAGLAADRFGGRQTLLCGGSILCLGGLVFPLAHTVPQLYAARILTGLGAGFIFLSIIKEVDTMWNPRHFVLLWGLTASAGGVGGLLGTTPFRRLADALNWRAALLVVDALTVLALVGTWLTLRQPGKAPPPVRRPFLRPLLSILLNRHSLPVLITSFVVFPVFFAIQATLGAKFLIDYCGLKADSAALILMLTISVWAAVGLLAGPLQKLTRQRRKPILLVGLSLGFAATLFMIWGALSHAHAGLYLVCFALLAVAASVTMPVGSGAIMKELNDPEVVSQSIAVSNVATYLGVAVLSNVCGLVLDRFAGQAVQTSVGLVYPGWAYAINFIILAALMLIALIAAFFVHETRGKSRHRGLRRLGALKSWGGM